MMLQDLNNTIRDIREDFVIKKVQPAQLLPLLISRSVKASTPFCEVTMVSYRSFHSRKGALNWMVGITTK